MGFVKNNLKIAGKEEPEYIRVDNSKGRIKGFLRTFFFKDHGKDVIYVPSLNLSGYGNDKKEALEMLDEITGDWFDTLMRLDSDMQQAELKKYGWEREKFRKKRYLSTVSVDKKGVLNNFELPEDTEIEEQSILV